MASIASQLGWTPSFGIRTQDSGLHETELEMEMRVPGIIFIVAFFIITSSHSPHHAALPPKFLWLASLGFSGSWLGFSLVH